MRAYYSEHIIEFLRLEPDRIPGSLAMHHQFALEELQKGAWLAQIITLKGNLGNFRSGYILFEYSIPRMGKQVDTILLLHGSIVVLEFKVGDPQYSTNALDQAIDDEYTVGEQIYDYFNTWQVTVDTVEPDWLITFVSHTSTLAQVGEPIVRLVIPCSLLAPNGSRNAYPENRL